MKRWCSQGRAVNAFKQPLDSSHFSPSVCPASLPVFISTCTSAATLPWPRKKNSTFSLTSSTGTERAINHQESHTRKTLLSSMSLWTAMKMVPATRRLHSSSKTIHKAVVDSQEGPKLRVSYLSQQQTRKKNKMRMNTR